MIAYAPCMTHGLKCGMCNVQQEMKAAVDAGYWFLYRYNPSKETALAIAVGARLSVTEARTLLQIAGFDWTDASVSDVVYRACLRHHVYEWEHK